MQRAPALVAFLLFVALCASLAYWLLQWLAPAPRAVAAPPESTRPLPPVAAAAALFGGRPTDAGGTALQLRGILQVGRSGNSVAIIAAEGRPPRTVAVDAEVLPGVTVKEIQARTVVLSERGAERELSLPSFAAQETGVIAAPAAAPEIPAAAASPPPQGAASSVGGGESGASASGAAAPSPSGPVQGVPPAGAAGMAGGRSLLPAPPESPSVRPAPSAAPSQPAQAPRPAQPQTPPRAIAPR